MNEQTKYTVVVINNETQSVLTISCNIVVPKVKADTFETWPPDPFGWMGRPLDDRKIGHWSLVKEVSLICIP